MYRPNNQSRNNREIKLQDVFLNYCRREKITVVVQLLDNSSKKGQIIGFDSTSIIMQENARQHLVYKSAAVAINPLSEVNYIFNESYKHDIIAETNDLNICPEYATDFS